MKLRPHFCLRLFLRYKFPSTRLPPLQYRVAYPLGTRCPSHALIVRDFVLSSEPCKEFYPDLASSTYNLPSVAGGAGLPTLLRYALASYLGAFFRVTEPVLHRLVEMGGASNAKAAYLLEGPLTASRGPGWAAIVCYVHEAALAL